MDNLIYWVPTIANKQYVCVCKSAGYYSSYAYAIYDLVYELYITSINICIITRDHSSNIGTAIRTWHLLLHAGDCNWLWYEIDILMLNFLAFRLQMTHIYMQSSTCIYICIYRHIRTLFSTGLLSHLINNIIKQISM